MTQRRERALVMLLLWLPALMCNRSSPTAARSDAAVAVEPMIPAQTPVLATPRCGRLGLTAGLSHEDGAWAAPSGDPDAMLAYPLRSTLTALRDTACRGQVVALGGRLSSSPAAHHKWR